MTVKPDPGDYLRSISRELSASMNRVRNLIGDSHWLSDGHHKEYLFLGILQRFLPTGFIAHRGFVVADQNLSSCSKEQDILIVDTRDAAPLFLSNGLVVTFPENLVMAISLKTNLNPESLRDSLLGLDTVRFGPTTLPVGIAIFSFSMQAAWKTNQALLGKWLLKNTTNLLKSHSESESNRPELLLCVNQEVFIAGDLSNDLSEQHAWRGQSSQELSAALLLAHIADILKSRCGNRCRSILDLFSDYEATSSTLFTNHELLEDPQM